MRLQQISIRGFKSFGKPVVLKMDKPITAIVGPNGSGKSNVVESIRFALGEQSIKSLRGGTSTDLLFKSGNSSRTADSASVTLQFDNSDRVFTLPALEHSGVSFNFDTVTIGREVASDGSQTYSINGTTVRMRDVAELISSVNIGASGHHIISQGEADRLLFAGPRERKVLLEEALGLKLYHYRINDTVRKLDRSADQLREAKLLVKEIEPHIKFLKKQVDMIHQSSELREKLIFQSSEYYAAYTQLLAQWKHTVTKRIQAVVETTQSKSEHIQKLEIELTTSRQNTRVDKHVQLESDIASAQQNLMDLMRSSGKIDMTVETLQHNIDSMRTSIKHHNQSHKKPEHIAYMAYVDFSDTLLAICDISIDSIESAQMVISDIKKHIQKFSLLQDKAVDNTLIEKLTLDIAESELALHNALAQQDQHSRSIDNAKSVVSELQITLHNATEQERNNTAHIHHSERLIDTAKTELAQLNYELQRTEREMILPHD